MTKTENLAYSIISVTAIGIFYKIFSSENYGIETNPQDITTNDQQKYEFNHQRFYTSTIPVLNTPTAYEAVKQENSFFPPEIEQNIDTNNNIEHEYDHEYSGIETSGNLANTNNE